MLGHDARFLGLLPVIGACSCVAVDAPTAAPDELSAAAPALIEEFEREPLTIPEALVRSGRESLAAGHHRAALQSLRMAVEQEPELASELSLDMVDALLGVGNFNAAEQLIATVRAESISPKLERDLQNRLVLAREVANARGFGDCEAEIVNDARPLVHAEDPFAAWNAVRSGLPADHAIPIPTSEAEARETLCASGCVSGEPTLVRLEGDNEASIALLVRSGDGFLVMPDLLHPIATSCEDETLFAVERHDGLVRVRAIGEQLDLVRAEDWHLVELPTYGIPPVSAPSYAYGSSGYQYQNQYQQQYQYQYGYNYYHGCGYGGYADEYGYGSTCEIQAHVERDVILDLERGEIVLDIVRSGTKGSGLGRVQMTSAPTGPVVDVEACGVQETLRLSYS